VLTAPISETAPLVHISDAASAAWSCISQRASRLAPIVIAARARSTRPRHSSISDKCIHKGTAAAVSATPIDASPAGENVQSSAARKLSIWRP
jgi:hypothetical protein